MKIFPAIDIKDKTGLFDELSKNNIKIFNIN